MLVAGFSTGALPKYDLQRVLDLAQDARMTAIEWSEHPHAPHTLGADAADLRKRAEDAGLEPVIYGSYFRLNEPEHSSPLTSVLDTAVALGVPMVRIWAGKTYGEEVRPSYWNAVVRQARTAINAAEERGLQLALEFHQHTLNNSEENWFRLRDAIGSPSLKTMWQPLPDEDSEAALTRLRRFVPALAHVHCYHWEHGVRKPLDRAWQAWLRYARFLRELDSTHAILLQMVERDTFENFLRDAESVRNLAKTKE